MFAVKKRKIECQPLNAQVDREVWKGVYRYMCMITGKIKDRKKALDFNE